MKTVLLLALLPLAAWAHTPIKQYTVNLDLPPEERYTFLVNEDHKTGEFLAGGHRRVPCANGIVESRLNVVMSRHCRVPTHR